METHHIIIQCHSFLKVTKTLLNYQYKYLNATEYQENGITFLTLEKAVYPYVSTGRMSNICYSFRYADLKCKRYPYEYIADAICELPYRFTRAKDDIDSFGVRRIIIYN